MFNILVSVISVLFTILILMGIVLYMRHRSLKAARALLKENCAKLTFLDMRDKTFTGFEMNIVDDVVAFRFPYATMPYYIYRMSGDKRYIPRSYLKTALQGMMKGRTYNYRVRSRLLQQKKSNYFRAEFDSTDDVKRLGFLFDLISLDIPHRCKIDKKNSKFYLILPLKYKDEILKVKLAWN